MKHLNRKLNLPQLELLARLSMLTDDYQLQYMLSGLGKNLLRQTKEIN